MTSTVLALKQQQRGVLFDPRAKFLALIIVASLLLSIGNEGLMGLVRIVLALVPFVLLVLSRNIKSGVTYIFIYLVAYGLSVISSMFLSGPLLLMMGYWFVSTTTVSEFMAACDRIRLTQSIEIPLVVMMRYFPTIAQDYSQISDAAKMKALGLSQGPITAVENRLVPLLASAVRGGEDLSAAALTRGLGAPIHRTNICEIGFHACDMMLLSVCALGAILVFLIGVA